MLKKLEVATISVNMGSFIQRFLKSPLSLPIRGAFISNFFEVAIVTNATVALKSKIYCATKVNAFVVSFIQRFIKSL